MAVILLFGSLYVLATFSAHYLNRHTDPSPFSFEDVEPDLKSKWEQIEEAEVDSSLGDWSVGFVDAMFLNEEAWFTPEFEEQLVDLTLPMMVFSGIDEEDPQMESFRRNGQLMDEIALSDDVG